MIVLFWGLFVINAVIVLFTFLVTLDKHLKNKTVKKTVKAYDDLNNNITKVIDNQETRLGKAISIFLSIFFIAGILISFGSIIWVPVIIWIIYGFKNAYIVLSLFLILTSFIALPFYYRMKDKVNNSESTIILQSFYILFIFYLMIIVVFPKRFPLTELMYYTYHNAKIFTNSLTIFIAIAFINAIIINFYFIYKGLIYLVKKRSTNFYWGIKLNDILILIVISSFIGLLYISENNYDFIPDSRYQNFEDILDIYKILLSALLVPLVFNKANMLSKKEEKKELIQ